MYTVDALIGLPCVFAKTALLLYRDQFSPLRHLMKMRCFYLGVAKIEMCSYGMVTTTRRSDNSR